MLKEEFRKKEGLESTVSVPQEHVHHYRFQVNELKSENKEFEQYGRRLCVRVDGVFLQFLTFSFLIQLYL